MARSAPLALVSRVSDELGKRGLRGSNIRIEERHRPRLVFEFSCLCGRRFECDLDVEGSLDFAVEAAWPRFHRACQAAAPVAAPLPEGPVRKATIGQLRQLWRDPFVRAVVQGFYTPARRHGEPSVVNVVGAIFPDGAVWRSGGPERGEPGPVPAYPPGVMPKAAKAK